MTSQLSGAMVITSKDYEMAELGKYCINALTNRNDCTVVVQQQLFVSLTLLQLQNKQRWKIVSRGTTEQQVGRLVEYQSCQLQSM